MYKIVGLTKMYALEIKDVEQMLDQVIEHIESGDPILIVSEIEDVEQFGINSDDVEIVD